MKVLLALNGSTGNRGCEAILLSTYDLLRSAFPAASFINCSEKDDRPGHTAYLALPHLEHQCHPDPFTFSGLRWQFAKRFLGHEYNFERFLPRADIVMSLGGDNYSLDYGSAEKYFQANERIMAKGSRLVIWGASIGPFTDDPDVERLAADQLKRVWRIVVRESRTRDYLASLGIVENVYQLPDPAFCLKPEPVELPAEIEARLRDGAVGLNLSPLLARYRGGHDGWLRDARHWLQRILQEVEGNVLLIPHVMVPGNDDREFLAQVLEGISADVERVRLLDASNLSSRQLKWVISRLRCFVGARTHATIAAMSSCVPTLSIGYSVKAVGINEDVFGTNRWVVSHKYLDDVMLAKLVNDLLVNNSMLRSELRERMKTYNNCGTLIPEMFGILSN